MDPVAPPTLEENKEKARSAVLLASQAAEEFHQDFKAFLSQVYNPGTWKEGVKLVMDGGLGLLKDLQEMITQGNWTPDKLVLRLNADLEQMVQKHPELQVQWDNVKVSFNFAKMKTDEALARMEEIAKLEYGKFDQGQVVKAVWSGVREEIKMDVSKLLSRFNHKETPNG